MPLNRSKSCLLNICLKHSKKEDLCKQNNRQFFEKSVMSLTFFQNARKHLPKVIHVELIIQMQPQFVHFIQFSHFPKTQGNQFSFYTFSVQFSFPFNAIKRSEQYHISSSHTFRFTHDAASFHIQDLVFSLSLFSLVLTKVKGLPHFYFVISF